MEQAPDLNKLSEQQLRELAGNLLAEVQQKDQTVNLHLKLTRDLHRTLTRLFSQIMA